MQALVATDYTTIMARGGARALPALRREFARIINAPPTLLHPEDRAGFLVAILADLAPDGLWIYWPDDVHIAALTAVKVLGRNPVGSDALSTPDHIATLLHHTGISPRVTTAPRVPPFSPPATEAMRALANTLVLHPPARRRFVEIGGGPGIARALSAAEHTPANLFLLGRIGFLATVNGKAVREMVDNDLLVPKLVHHLAALPVVPANYDALSELLKFTANILRFYPQKVDGDDEPPWDAKLDPLLAPILSIVHRIPFNDLLPPLTHALHALISIPLSPELLPTWYATPGAGRQSSSQSRDKKKGSKSGSPPSGGFSDGQLSPTPSGSFLSFSGPTPTAQTIPRRLLAILNGFVDSHLPGTAAPDPELIIDEVLPPVLALAAHTATGSIEMRMFYRSSLFPRKLDRSPEAGPLEGRPGLLGTLLRLMNTTHSIHSRDTAGEFLWAVCSGDAGELCDEIGYGNAAGLLYRKGLSGPPPARVVELPDEPRPAPPRSPAPTSHSPSPSTSTSYDRHNTASSLGHNTGSSLGHERRHTAASGHSHHTVASSNSHERHPITGLDAPPDDGTSPFDGMTDEEKEREAEKMFVLFERLNRNPIIKAGAPTPDGGTKSLKEAMSDKVASGEAERWEAAEAERVRAEALAQDEADEEEAAREMEAYFKRKHPQR
ncbi:hypothetical protein Q8F55_007528 [Vanrija albida]|uniref:Uncharacterized protein n=1 Tax=Vanrija albida TaxID=181172 RepID=A0ABR3PTS1_9TREE